MLEYYFQTKGHISIPDVLYHGEEAQYMAQWSSSDLEEAWYTLSLPCLLGILVCVH